MSDNVLVISYFAKRMGCCPAEWVDDKVDSLIKLDKKVILVSSIWSDPFIHPQVTHYRVPSLSPKDFMDEMKEAYPKQDFSLLTFLWLPLILIFGVPLDLLQYFATNGLGGGKISWAISSTIASFYCLLRHRVNLVLCTGGPASAHMSGIFSGKLFGKPVIAEFQDPLSGEGIGRNSRSAQLLFLLERTLVNYCDKVVYVTKQAALEAKEKFQKKDKVFSIYPGARRLRVAEKEELNDSFTLVHLGTLYSTRNFDTLIEAIEILIEEKRIKEGEIKILNIGEIYGEYKESYLKKSYVRKLNIMPREEAIFLASKQSVSLLVQHNDPRSATTIPYKTYDYFNISNPILGLTNSHELSNLLSSNGHYVAHINNPKEIAETIFDIFSKSKDQGQDEFKGIDPVEQTKSLIELS